MAEIGSARLCRTDMHIVEGQWADRANLAYTLSQENAVNDAMDDLDGGRLQDRGIPVAASHRTG